MRLRRIGNSLGLILPKEYVAERGLKPNDSVRVEIERALRIEDVAGRLKKYRRSVSDWNPAPNEGEDL